VPPVLRTLRTVRHLRPGQLGWLIVRRLQGPVRPPRLSLGVADDRWERVRAAVLLLGPGDPNERVRRAEAVLRGEFSFLNLTRSFDQPDWRGTPAPRLWAYHLHYFDYGADLAWAWHLTGNRRFLERFSGLALGWVAATMDGSGPGWEPYPISVRVRRWLEALLLAGSSMPGESRNRLLASVASQCAVLSRRLERHLRANHLQRNIQALAQAGWLFDGPVAERWRVYGPDLWAVVLEQVLEDGTHYERSPMYHALALDDFLEAVAWARAVGVPIPGPVLVRLGRMTSALAVLTRSDGRLHLFGDSAAGMAPPVATVARRAEVLLGARVPARRGLQELGRGGFVAYTGERGDRIVITAGEPSPPEQPAHSHADLLSFELELTGRPWIVDSGVSGYEDDPARAYVRSTAGHNTVAIAGEDQSEMWGTFRVGGRPAGLRVSADVGSPGGFRFLGQYHPWRRRSACHHRVIERREAGWNIEDRIEGAAGLPLTSYLHFAPDVVLGLQGPEFVASAGGCEIEVCPFGADRVHVRRAEDVPPQGWHCPEFGVRLPAWALELAVDANDGRRFGWQIQVRR
jgi:hypothetical protein